MGNTPSCSQPRKEDETDAGGVEQEVISNSTTQTSHVRTSVVDESQKRKTTSEGEDAAKSHKRRTTMEAEEIEKQDKRKMETATREDDEHVQLMESSESPSAAPTNFSQSTPVSPSQTSAQVEGQTWQPSQPAQTSAPNGDTVVQVKPHPLDHTLSVHGTRPLYEILTPKEVKLILYSVYMARFLAVLDATIVAVSIPSILKDLGGVQYLSWLIAAYLLSDSVILPLSGRLSDIYGRRLLYLISLVTFLIGSILCGAATSIWFLIGARFLQGLGGGGLTGMTMIIPGDIIPPKERPQIFAVLGIIAGLGALLGPILGGGLTDAYSWRLVFYINVPFGVFSFGLAWYSMKQFDVGGKAKLELDIVGSVLIAFSTICLILFVTWGGEGSIGYPWNSGQIIALIVLFAVFFVAFMFQEYRHPLPTLQLRLHKIKNVWMCYVIVFVAYYSMISTVNYMSIYFQYVMGDKAVISGLKLGGFVVGFIVMSKFSGKLLMKTSKSNYIMGFSCFLTALGMGLLNLITPTLNYGFIFLFTTLLGIGVGYLIPVTGAIIQVSVPQRDIAVAMANFSFDSYIGGCIGITVSGTIFTRTLTSKLAGVTNPAGVATAYSDAVGQVFLWCVPPLIFIGLLGFFLDPVKKKKPKEVGGGEAGSTPATPEKGLLSSQPTGLTNTQTDIERQQSVKA